VTKQMRGSTPRIAVAAADAVGREDVIHLDRHSGARIRLPVLRDKRASPHRAVVRQDGVVKSFFSPDDAKTQCAVEMRSH
jgi:hypothetical protein